MTHVYIIKDKTDSNFYKPFVAIHKNKANAEQNVLNLKSRLSQNLHALISYESIKVDDFDINKNNIYIVFDKTDGNKKPFVSMHFELANATASLTKLRKGVSKHAHKFIYTACEKIQ